MTIHHLYLGYDFLGVVDCLDLDYDMFLIFLIVFSVLFGGLDYLDVFY